MMEILEKHSTTIIGIVYSRDYDYKKYKQVYKERENQN